MNNSFIFFQRNNDSRFFPFNSLKKKAIRYLKWIKNKIENLLKNSYIIANLSTFLINFFLPFDSLPGTNQTGPFEEEKKLLFLLFFQNNHAKEKKKRKEKIQKNSSRRHSFLIANLPVPSNKSLPLHRFGTWRRFRAVPPINISIRNVLGPGTREPPTWKGPPPGGSSRASAPCIFVPPPFEK